MAKIIECVPNFSEGVNKDVIDAISKAISETDGCTLLDVDPGSSTNRTVYTFVGDENSVVEGALNGAKVAFHLIDMRKHSGEHKRLGALDVCPFIPVKNASKEDCVKCANIFGERAAKEIGIPIYLYGHASTQDYRKTVPQIRAGEYEGLQEKIQLKEWVPDYGEAEFIPSWGATIAGARDFLIAYNINVLGTKEQAHRLALNLREQGRGPEAPGRFKNVQGMGWYLEEANMAQTSLNLLDFNSVNVNDVFEAAVEDARALKIGICGSEIVGLVPLEAILKAAHFYIEREGLFIIEEEQKVKLAIERLGLSSIKQFVPKERIIEYMVGTGEVGPLASSTVKQFICSLGSRSSAPGGGSASAAIAGIGAALGLMVGWMSFGNRKYEALDSTMRQLIPPLHSTMSQLIPMIDADTSAFNDYMAAMKLPKTSDEEMEHRDKKMQEGLKVAISVPLKVMEIANGCWDEMLKMAEVGNPTTLSDMQVGARSLETGIYGAHCNVIINLKDITDASYKTQIKEKADGILASAKVRLSQVIDVIEKRMNESN